MLIKCQKVTNKFTISINNCRNKWKCNLKSTKFVQEFNNIDINTYLNTIVKELKLEIENSNEKKNVINNHVTIGKKQYRILGEYVKSKQNDKKEAKKNIWQHYIL